MNPPSRQPQTAEGKTVDADSLNDKIVPSIADVKDAVRKLRGEKAAGICNISTELLRPGGEAMIRGLHAVLSSVGHSSNIPSDWKIGYSSLSERGEWTGRTATANGV